MAEVQVGDRVSIDPRKIGLPRRIGTVTTISQGLSGARYTVAWDGGGSTVFTPGAGNFVIEGPKTRKAAADRKKTTAKANSKAKATTKTKAKPKPKAKATPKAKAATKTKAKSSSKAGAKKGAKSKSKTSKKKASKR